MQKTLTGLAAAIAAVGFTASAQAATVLDFARSAGGGVDLAWTRDADNVGGNLDTVLSGGAAPVVSFTIEDNALTNGPLTIDADFTLHARDDQAATIDQGQIEQWHLQGDLAFTAKDAFTYNGHSYAAGTNLLTASFTNAKLHGAGHAGGFDGSDGVGLTLVDYSSDVLNRTKAFQLDTFSLALTANPTFSATGCGPDNGDPCSTALRNFTASSSGLFSAAVPEPASWALMILGFGGAGGMIRRRRVGGAVA